VPEPPVLSTTAGDLPLEEVSFCAGDHTLQILHTGAVVSREDEQRFLANEGQRVPYGTMLWPAALALSQDVAGRDLRGKRALELGAGTGLPGIVAARRGARVVQTDRQPVALHVCKMNAERNGVRVEHRLADWTAWGDDERYDYVLASDVLYAPPMHSHLRRIFEQNVKPGGTVLVSDPFRDASLSLLEVMESEGWSISMTKWTVGVAPPLRPVAVYELRRPAREELSAGYR
jgi:predicted nicotinamide N-methyase